MKTISLVAENLKRITAVAIRPKGNVVEISGKNAQGKTSIMDSLWIAIEGAAAMQGDPIRHGADEARIKIVMGPREQGGNLIVSRRIWRREDNSIAQELRLEAEDGTRFTSPQKTLDAFVGTLSFDPHEFMRMKAADQFDALRRFVPDFDFADFTKSQAADYNARTDINRVAKDRRTRAQAILVPDDAPSEAVDVDALIKQLANASADNDELRQYEHKRTNLAHVIGLRTNRAVELRAEAVRHAAELNRQADFEEAAAKEYQIEFDGMPEGGPLIETAYIEAQIAAARERSEQFRHREERRKLIAEAETAETTAQELTDAIDWREKDKREKIAAAAMPIEGLGFGDGVVLFNNVPLEQASSAEQWKVCVALAMAMNPTLRVIRITDGSLLDDDSLAAIETLAADKDYQVWIETVRPGTASAVIIEDGHVKGQDPALIAESSTAARSPKSRKK